jgi:hypothetical protein
VTAVAENVKHQRNAPPPKQDDAAADGSRPSTAEAETFYRRVRRSTFAEVRAMVDNGLDVNAKDATGMPHLAAAIAGTGVSDGADDRLPLLFIERGADVAATDANGETALSWAAACSRGVVVKALLDRGADVKVTRRLDGMTPLHRAMEGMEVGSGGIAVMLIARGADVNARERSGCTPLHIAAYRGYAEAVKVLLAHGADPTLKCADGQTPLAYARERRGTGGDEGRERVAKLLEGQGVRE